MRLNYKLQNMVQRAAKILDVPVTQLEERLERDLAENPAFVKMVKDCLEEYLKKYPIITKHFWSKRCR